MGNFSVYYNPLTKSTSLSDVEGPEMARIFTKLITVDKLNENKHHFLLKPITAFLKVPPKSLLLNFLICKNSW